MLSRKYSHTLFMLLEFEIQIIFTALRINWFISHRKQFEKKSICGGLKCLKSLLKHCGNLVIYQDALPYKLQGFTCSNLMIHTGYLYIVFPRCYFVNYHDLRQTNIFHGSGGSGLLNVLTLQINPRLHMLFLITPVSPMQVIICKGTSPASRP